MNRAACLWRDRIAIDADGTIAVPEAMGSAMNRKEKCWSDTASHDAHSQLRSAPAVALQPPRPQPA